MGAGPRGSETPPTGRRLGARAVAKTPPTAGDVRTEVGEIEAGDMDREAPDMRREEEGEAGDLNGEEEELPGYGSDVGTMRSEQVGLQLASVSLSSNPAVGAG